MLAEVKVWVVSAMMKQLLASLTCNLQFTSSTFFSGFSLPWREKTLGAKLEGSIEFDNWGLVN